MEMVDTAAPHHLPAFITAPGNTDILLVFSGIFLIAAVLAAGVFFFWLHSLPERMVHNRLQYDLVAVLALLSLFTHVHAFWIAALLLAFITVPDSKWFDILTPLRSIAKSLRSIAEQAEKPALAASPAQTPRVEATPSSTQSVTKEP